MTTPFYLILLFNYNVCIDGYYARACGYYASPRQIQWFLIFPGNLPCFWQADTALGEETGTDSVQK